MTLPSNRPNTVQTGGTECQPSDETCLASEDLLRSITRNVPGVIFQFYARRNGEFGFNYVSDHPLVRLGLNTCSLEGVFDRFVSAVAPEDRERFLVSIRRAVESVSPWRFEGKLHQSGGEELHFLGSAQPRRVRDELVFDGLILDITERKRAKEALERRIIALTSPVDAPEGIAFEDLFNLADIQHLQDLFAEACAVASIITRPDGTPITRPSNFCSLCKDIIRKTEKGLKNCYCSDAILGRYNPDGPTIQPCLSGGLWDAGASITVGGRHIANWLIGQVRNEAQDEERMMDYAREIGADEQAFREALRTVRSVAKDRFVLACGSPMGPAVGLCDGMRIGYDVSSRWWVPMNLGAWPSGNCNIRAAAIHTFWRQWMHQVWWQNDPDCLVVRP